MITKQAFGCTNNGEKATLYTIDNGQAQVGITDFGAAVVSFRVRDKKGNPTDIVLGYDDVSGYDNDRETYFGATVGRYAGRIENAGFILNGKEYPLTANNGKNTLHGGKNNFSFKMYEIELLEDAIRASLHSPDGEEGFPGNLDFSVTFTLKGTSLSVEYSAQSDKDTLVNFTNHSYFNLCGATSGESIYNHLLEIDADAFCEVDAGALPTGVIRPVRNSVMDFRKPVPLGERITCDDPVIAICGGIDNNFVLSMSRGELRHAASLYNPENGIYLECLTDQPGLQIYTANFTDTVGKDNTPYGRHSAVCLETQSFPNSSAFRYFPSALLKANERFYSKTVYTAAVK